MELKLIKLAKDYKENPEKGAEVFEKIAIGFLSPLVAAGRAGLSAASRSLAARGGVKGLAQGAKQAPRKAWDMYRHAWKTAPGSTGLNTLMAADMIKGGSEKYSAYDRIQARYDLLNHMHEYNQTDSDEKKSFHKKAALEALMIMGH